MSRVRRGGVRIRRGTTAARGTLLAVSTLAVALTVLLGSAVADQDQAGVWLGQDGSALPFADEQALLAFLETAQVVESKEIGKGITRPKRLVLEKDGVRARALFHHVRVTRNRHRLASGEMVMYFRDSYENNVAAYKLSRLMGIQNVPPATVRKVDGKEGSVQLWIEDSYDETDRKRSGTRQTLPVEVRRRIADMWVFDNLINNIDRNQGNMLYDSVGGFWWIDHTRSFARADRLFSPDRIIRCSRSLFAALKELELGAVSERLGEHIDKFEIRSLLKRRDKVVDVLEDLIEARGEERVLFSYDDPDESVSVSYGEADIPEPPGDDG